MYSLAIIARNCAADLDKCLSSYGKFPDEVVVVNTGISEDEEGFKETNNVAQQHGAKVFHFPWCEDFSKARNFSFEKCTHDWVLWLDTDDTIKNPVAFDRALRQVEKSAAVGAAIAYLYEFDDLGNCTTKLIRERFIFKPAWEWRAPIHECLCQKYEGHVEVIPEKYAAVLHTRKRGDFEKAQENLRRNLKVFEANWPDGDCETRMKYYWGNTHFGLGNIDAAIPLWEEYIAQSGNRDEIYIALNFCCEARRVQGKFAESMDYAKKAIGLFPSNPSAYHQASETCAAMEDLDAAEEYANLCLQFVGNQTNEMVNNPKHLLGRPHYVLAYCAVRKNNWDKAAHHIEQCRAVFGEEDETIGVIADQAKAGFEFNRLLGSFRILADQLDTPGKQALATLAPEQIKTHPLVARLKLKPKGPGRSIAFLCPTGVSDPWGPESPEKGGCGGSEEAVINMAREFAKLNWHVEMYSPHVTGGVKKDGVTWYGVQEFGGETDHFDVVVTHRAVDAPLHTGLNTTTSYLWLHDVPMPGWQYGIWNLYDKIFCLSEYHNGLFKPIVPEHKLHVTRNAMDKKLFEPITLCQNAPAKFIWGSCPSRGLDRVLKLWPEILKHEPEAELHIFYGWGKTFLDHMKMQGPDGELARVYDEVGALVDQPGVTWHGRVDQKKLNRWYAKCGTWLYPTSFPEISCITAMKAQAHGCVPIVTDDFALSETVKYGYRISADPATPEGMATFLEAVKAHLDNPLPEKKQEMIEWARSNTWEALAKEWEALFLEAVKEEPKPKVVRQGVVPRWMVSSD